MSKGKLWLHQLVLFGLLGVLILWSVFNKVFVFNINLLWWLLGAVVGFLFVFLDRVFYSIFSKPEEASSLKLKELFARKNFVGGISLLLSENYNLKEAAMRSAMFVVTWVVLAFLTVTSVPNFFARGLMLGIGTHLVFDLIYDFKTNKERFDQWFWHIKRTLEPNEKVVFVYIIGIVYLLLAFNL
jgi:hypothetical protein